MKYDLNINLTVGSSHTLILQRIKPKSRVLEFGSATGYMTRYMKEELGCTVFCVEVDADAAKLAESYSEKMIVADLDEMKWCNDLEGEFFDFVLFADVLEHLKKPQQVLSNAVSFLKKEGVVITSIPNISHNSIIMELIQNKFDYRSEGLLDDTHIHFFTRNSIIDMLEKTNLAPVEWLATMLRPENTEFKQEYNLFPSQVQQMLLSREDAHVYQFVTVSKKKEDLINIETLKELSTPENYLDDDFLQIYWDKKKNYMEGSSIKEKIVLNKGFIHYSIELPLEAEGYLRLDPSNSHGFIEIKSIDIYSINNNIKSNLFNYSSSNKFRGIVAGANLITLDKNEYYQLMSLDKDPNIELDSSIPKDFNGGVRIIEIIMNISNDIQTMTQKITQQLQKNIKQIQETENEIKEKVNKIQEIETNIEEIENNILEDNKRHLFEVDNLGSIVQLEKNKNLTLSNEITEKNLIIANLLNSNSWRYTKFFRWLGKMTSTKKIK